MGETQSLPKMQPTAERVEEGNSLAFHFLLPSSLLPMTPISWTPTNQQENFGLEIFIGQLLVIQARGEKRWGKII